MGPNKHTDAQNKQIDNSLLQVIHQLDQPQDVMDTDWIDAQLDSMPRNAMLSFPAYEKTMRNAAAAYNVQKARTAKRRFVQRVAAVAASLLIVAITSFSVANAFQWNSFLRIFSAQNGILSFQTPVKNDGSIGYSTKAGEEDLSQQGKSVEEPQNENITIASAEELLSLSTPGDKAFRPMLDKFTFQSGDLNKTETDKLLTIIFLDSSSNSLMIQVSTVNEEFIGKTASSVFFEIDEGSEKKVRIGDDTVITCTNIDINTVQWVTKLGFCHIWSKASHEELLNVAKIFLDAGLKPV